MCDRGPRRLRTYYIQSWRQSMHPRIFIDTQRGWSMQGLNSTQCGICGQAIAIHTWNGIPIGLKPAFFLFALSPGRSAQI